MATSRIRCRTIGNTKRLLLQPAIFYKDNRPRFTAERRAHRMYFPYPWTEEDTIHFALPAGFLPDNPSGIQSLKAGSISSYDASLAIANDSSELIYARKFVFGSSGQTLFDVESYPGLKSLFEAVAERDGYTLSLIEGHRR
jgi:hypothetical protein